MALRIHSGGPAQLKALPRCPSFVVLWDCCWMRVGRTGHKVLKQQQPSACCLYSAALGMCPSVYVLRNRSLRRPDVNTLSVSLHPVFIWCEYLRFASIAVCRYHAGPILRYWVSLNTPSPQCYQLFMQRLAPADGCFQLNKDSHIGNTGTVSVLCLHGKKSLSCLDT